MNDKTLANLKEDYITALGLVGRFPRNRAYQHEAESRKRLVQAREREIFCNIKGPK